MFADLSNLETVSEALNTKISHIHRLKCYNPSKSINERDGKGGYFMNTFTHQSSTKSLLDELDEGIDDMESGNEVSIDDSYRIVTDMVNQYKLKIIITNEALHDIIDIEIYILCQFGDNRQQKFHNQIFNEISALSLSAFAYSNYSCRSKKLFLSRLTLNKPPQHN